MKLKAMKNLKTALKEFENELLEKTNNIDWNKSDGMSWSDECQQREEYYSFGLDKLEDINYIISEIEETTLDEF